MRISNFEQTGLNEISTWLNDNDSPISSSTLSNMLKMCNISFVLEGISRVQSTLICELGDSYVQQSQRYVTISEDSYVKPKFAQSDLEKVADELIQRAFNLYEKMTELKEDAKTKGRPKVEDYKYGIPIEDARYILPLAFKTNISVAMSGDKLINFFALLTDKYYYKIMADIQEELVKHIPSTILSLILAMYCGPVRLQSSDELMLKEFYEPYLGEITDVNNMILIDAFSNLDIKAGLGAITSTSGKAPSEVLKDWGADANDKATSIVKRVLGYGHSGISEQARTTFGMMCSLVTYHQQIRHRLPKMYSEDLESLTKNSYRRVIIPETIEKSKFITEFIEISVAFKLFRMSITSYEMDDKYNYLPNMLLNCEQIKMIISTNARIDCEMLSERTCLTAQSEILKLSRKKLDILRGLSPVLYEGALPPCVYGKCKEGPLTCGKSNEVKEYFLGKDN